MQMTRISLVLFVLCFALSCSKADVSQYHPPAPEVGNIAPDFRLKDPAGREIALSSYKGKVVLVEFWASWCPPCRATVPELIDLQNKYKDKGFTVLGLSIDADSDAVSVVEQFSRSNRINYPLLIANDDVIKSYNIASIPVSFLIDRSGKIADIHMGYVDNLGRKLSGQIERLL